MIYAPSEEIEFRMRAERGGVWIDRGEPDLWLIAKLPTNIIREIAVGAAVTLQVWLVEIEGYLVATFGFTVYDDPICPMTYYGSCRSDEETADLTSKLAIGSCPLQVHNENFLPLLQAVATFDSEAASDLLELLPSARHPEERGFELRDKANDIVEDAIEGVSGGRVKAHCEIPVVFRSARVIRVHLNGIGTVDVSHPDEGGELERLTSQAFGSLFQHGTFLGPYYLKSGLQKEVCDVLAISRNREVHTEGIFIVQSKVASASTVGLKRKTQRRADTIQKNILEAIDQLRGAIKTLKSGVTIYRKDGTSIEDDQHIPALSRLLEPLNLKERADAVGFAVVMISDMHPNVDWDRKVFLALGQLFIDTRYYCHVMDLQELGRILTHCDNRPVKLEYLLMERWKHMIANRTTFIRFQFDLKPPESLPDLAPSGRAS
jgi:hypothetical protein